MRVANSLEKEHFHSASELKVTCEGDRLVISALTPSGLPMEKNVREMIFAPGAVILLTLVLFLPTAGCGRGGEGAAALKRLSVAIRLAPSLAQQAREDPDLAPLRDDDVFRRIVDVPSD